MTIKDNMPLIRQFHGTIFSEQFVDDLLSSFDHLLPALARFDNKDKGDQTPPSREDVVSLLRNLNENTELQCVPAPANKWQYSRSGLRILTQFPFDRQPKYWAL